MIDVSRKLRMLRTATAEATLRLAPLTLEAIRTGNVPEGDPFEVARVAGVLAAKNAAQFLPYCHPLPLDHVAIIFVPGDDEIVITATVKAIHKTGVEMPALSAATVAALTLYDLLKGLDDSLVITDVKLAGKSGERNGVRGRFETPLRAAVLVMSNSVADGSRDDLSGRAIEERLVDEGLKVEDYKVIPDDPLRIIEALTKYADTLQLDLVLTAGGTGFSPRDHTPEAMARVIEREIPGIPEVLRAYGQERMPQAMLTRGKAGIRGQTIIVNLPGSKRAVTEALDALFPGLLHAFALLRGGPHPAAPRTDDQP